MNMQKIWHPMYMMKECQIESQPYAYTTELVKQLKAIDPTMREWEFDAILDWDKAALFAANPVYCQFTACSFNGVKFPKHWHSLNTFVNCTFRGCKIKDFGDAEFIGCLFTECEIKLDSPTYLFSRCGVYNSKVGGKETTASYFNKRRK